MIYANKPLYYLSLGHISNITNDLYCGLLSRELQPFNSCAGIGYVDVELFLVLGRVLLKCTESLNSLIALLRDFGYLMIVILDDHVHAISVLVLHLLQLFPNGVAVQPPFARTSQLSGVILCTPDQS